MGIDIVFSSPSLVGILTEIPRLLRFAEYALELLYDDVGRNGNMNVVTMKKFPLFRVEFFKVAVPTRQGSP
jgi:hypothetical protein